MNDDIMTFEDLGLGPDTLKALSECGYDTPTPIQAQAIPAVLMMRDVVGLAQTGTGKTAGFILPMLEILHGGRARARMPRSLILEPTRELAAQVAENFDTYGRYHGLDKALLVGGESMIEQKKILDKGVDVLIATPGRLLDLFERGSILLTDIKVLVIDEADRMLDMGFIPDIEKIISFVPPTRQTLLFSATMPDTIEKLADKFLSNPKRVAVAATSSAAETVEQTLIKTTKRKKKDALVDILNAEKDLKNAFIFCNRKRDAGTLATFLKKKGFGAAPLHGDMVQSERTRILQGFRDGEITHLVCSDVVARGIDIDGVSHVFNYDVPFNAEDYIHRIGRTGRAGMSGKAFTLMATDDEQDEKLVGAIESLIGRALPAQETNKKPRRKKTDEEDEGKAEEKAPSKNKRPARNRSRGKEAAPTQESDSPSHFTEDTLPAFLR